MMISREIPARAYALLFIRKGLSGHHVGKSLYRAGVKSKMRGPGHVAVGTLRKLDAGKQVFGLRVASVAPHEILELAHVSLHELDPCFGDTRGASFPAI